MWRLYGQNAAGVRISAKAKDLLFQAYNSHDLLTKHEYFKVKLGRVLYLEEEKLREKLLDEFIEFIAPENADDGVLDSLFYKRKAYHTENEVRLVANDGSNLGDRETGRLYAPLINLNWISEITFGPRMSEKDYDENKQKLLKAGIDESKIKLSALYGRLHYTIDLSKK